MRFGLPALLAALAVPSCGPATNARDAALPTDAADTLEPDSGPDAPTDAQPEASTPEAGADSPADTPSCPDRDGDGHRDMACGGDDCNDNDRLVHPGADPRCADVDSDCDGTPDTREELALVDRWCRENSLTASSRYEEGVQCVFAGRTMPLFAPAAQPSCVGCTSVGVPSRSCSCWSDNTVSRLCEPRM